MEEKTRAHKQFEKWRETKNEKYLLKSYKKGFLEAKCVYARKYLDYIEEDLVQESLQALKQIFESNKQEIDNTPYLSLYGVARTLAEYYKDKDLAEARKWFIESESCFMCTGPRELATRYANGCREYGIEKDTTKAQEWIEVARSRGSPESMLNNIL